MNRVLFALALAVLAAGAAPARAASDAPPAVSRTTSATIVPLGTGADYAIVDEGVQAPDFAYESDAGWRRLHDLRAAGHVLLVFGAGDDRLAALESECATLRALGVLPVAIVDRKSGGCRRLAQKLHLDYPVVADPRGVIGAQFNALDPFSRADAAAWFVLGRDGRVRRLAHDSWPSQSWSEVVTQALGLDASRNAAYPGN